METGTRAERADEGAGVGLGSRNALREPSKQRKLEKVKRKKQIVGLWSKNDLRDPRERKNKQKKAVQEVFAGLWNENGLRDPREKGTGGLWMWQ